MNVSMLLRLNEVEKRYNKKTKHGDVCKIGSILPMFRVLGVKFTITIQC